MMVELFQLYEFANKRHYEVLPYCFNLAQVKGVSLPLNAEDSCYIGIDYNNLESETEEKTILAHELGHCVRGAFYNRYAKCDVRQRHEIRADKWAITKLISEEDLDNALASGYTEIWSLADYFSVTEEFMRKVVCWYVYHNLDVEHYMNFVG